MTATGLVAILVTIWAIQHRKPSPGPPVSLRTVVVSSDSPLFGGWRLYLDTEGESWLWVAEYDRDKRGLVDRHYTFRLSPEQRAELERLVGYHNILKLSIKPGRYGIPDEIRLVMYVRALDGTERAPSKWRGEPHPDFDPVFDYLRDITRAVRAGKPVFVGEHDINWQPAGFPTDKEIGGLLEW